MSGKEKLVRDKHIITPRPNQEYRIAPDEERDELLEVKIDEEVEEFKSASRHPNSTPEEIAREAGDAIEAILARAKRRGISSELVEKIRLSTREKRGGFDNGIVLIINQTNTSRNQDE